MAGFNLIRKRLSEMYKMITLDDGDADLEPHDRLDPFAEGISFRVRPPKKSWKYIHNLSGGEMTVSQELSPMPDHLFSSARSLLFLLCTVTNPPRFISWMRSMLL
jgi:hypothetical protein